MNWWWLIGIVLVLVVIVIVIAVYTGSSSTEETTTGSTPAPASYVAQSTTGELTPKMFRAYGNPSSVENAQQKAADDITRRMAEGFN